VAARPGRNCVCGGHIGVSCARLLPNSNHMAEKGRGKGAGKLV
jgi:hypothetical protein